MTIEERIQRRAPEDIIHIGQLAENVLKSEMGVLLYALTSGRIATEASNNSNLNAERILGRIQGYQRLMNDLEQYVIDKNKLLQERQEETVELQESASSPGN